MRRSDATLEDVVANGADGLETMTPPGMGGDCDLAEAYRRVGDKLFFIGGFDQREGFEANTPQRARELVLECHGLVRMVVIFALHLTTSSTAARKTYILLRMPQKNVYIREPITKVENNLPNLLAKEGKTYFP